MGLKCWLIGHRFKVQTVRIDFFDGHIYNKCCIRCGYQIRVHEIELTQLAEGDDDGKHSSRNWR